VSHKDDANVKNDSCHLLRLKYSSVDI